MDQDEIDSAKATAQIFFNEMNQWELWCATLERNASTAKARHDKLEQIFNTYLSSKALKRKQSRLDMLMFGRPPEFSEPIVKTEEAGKGKVWIYVPEGGIGGHARFLVVEEMGNWKIDTRESDVANDGKWVKTPDL